VSIPTCRFGVLLGVAVAALALTCIPSVTADQISLSQCQQFNIQFPTPIPPFTDYVCANLSISSCNDSNWRILIRIGSSPAGPLTTVVNISESGGPPSVPSFPLVAGCTAQVSFPTWTLNGDYDEICISGVVTCTIGSPITISLGCYYYPGAVQCSTLTDCSSCRQYSYCGWCQDTGVCDGNDYANNLPYCSTCVSSTWWNSNNPTKCPPNDHIDSNKMALGVTVGVPVAVGSAMAFGTIVFCVRRKRANETTAPPGSVPLGDHDTGETSATPLSVNATTDSSA